MESILKLDEELRVAYGWAAITKLDGADYVDLQDDVIDAESLQRAVVEFMANGGQAGLLHGRDKDGRPVTVGRVVECLVVDDAKLEAMFGKSARLPDSPRGLFVGVKVEDESVWKAIKAGRLRGFSIAGTGIREAI